LAHRKKIIKDNLPGSEHPNHYALSIASYPLTPMENVKEIYFDLFINGGNSGGPIYYSYTNRLFKGQVHLGGLIQGILGLVTQEAHSSRPEFFDKTLNFGVIVPAPFIRETIRLLPPQS
jgi:hypothetical protein